MKNILLLLAFVVASAGTACAQEASVVFHPGESIHILVTLKTPTIPFDNTAFYFGLVGQPDKLQAQLGRGFQGNEYKKISDTQFEISGKIPDHTATGNFTLNWISVNINGVGKVYDAGSDFKSVTVTVINSEHPDFPAIDDVKLVPHS
jgi:hypothetical protein